MPRQREKEGGCVRESGKQTSGNRRPVTGRTGSTGSTGRTGSASGGGMSADAEERRDELLALQSILGPDEFVRDDAEFSGEIRVGPEVPAGFTVALREGETPIQFEVSFLPPVRLTFDLPESYPSSAPPAFSLACSWLTPPQLAALEAQLLRLHQASGGAVVLFSWVQFLREDALGFLEVGSSLEIPADMEESGQEGPNARLGDRPGLEAAQEGEQPPDKKEGNEEEASPTEGLPGVDRTSSGSRLTPAQALLTRLLAFDDAHKEKVFSSTVFDCGVCFAPYLGSECVRLPGCDHVFCRACLGEFCRVQISGGHVRGVACLQGDCDGSPSPAQVKSLVGEELFARYDRLLLQTTLDCMPDVVYCPRPSCASAVIQEAASQVALCSVCGFAFCVSCRKTYHGEEDCRTSKPRRRAGEGAQGDVVALPQSYEGIVALWDDYASGSKQRQRLLEQRYGRHNLHGSLEEQLSTHWITGNSKKCPYCFSKIEKNSGCSMMTCSRCRRQFCWTCLAKFSGSNAYQHYRETNCSLY